MPRTRRIYAAPPGGFRLPPIHPGGTLAGELAARQMTVQALALKVGIPANRISAIIAGRQCISADIALRLGRYFGTGARFWMKRQRQDELAVATSGL